MAKNNYKMNVNQYANQEEAIRKAKGNPNKNVHHKKKNSNYGGSAAGAYMAQKVAEKLAGVARTKQVLCVTHLPQLAAMADVHFSVEKGERKGRTFTEVERLSRERRMEELARLTSGERITGATLAAAGELLDSAERFKRALTQQK